MKAQFVARTPAAGLNAGGVVWLTAAVGHAHRVTLRYIGLATPEFAIMVAESGMIIESVDAFMLVGVTRTQRRRAGWLVALAYLFCVLVPTIASALPGGHAAPHCLTGDDHIPSMVHEHHEGMAHIHGDGHQHHSGVLTHADSAASHDAKSAVLKNDPVPAEASHAMDEKCCGLMCITALPAPFVAMAQPPAPNAVRMADNHRKLTDNTPPRLYRPPNS